MRRGLHCVTREGIIRLMRKAPRLASRGDLSRFAGAVYGA